MDQVAVYSLMFEREKVAGFVAYAFRSAGPGSQSARANVYDTWNPYLERGSSKRQMLTPYEQSTAQSSEQYLTIWFSSNRAAH